MRLAWRRSCSALALLLLGCTEFPVVPADVCGNSVVDAKEDCDIFSGHAGASCRPPGAAEACHYDCSLQNDGQRTPCPPGWGCDGNSVCREPTDGFQSPSAPLDVGAWSLTAGDFDGDRRGDLLCAEPLDALGETRFKFLYFDDEGGVEETFEFPKRVIAPVVADLSGDGISDVAFSLGRLSVMNGRPDRTWIQETFASYRITNAGVRVVGVAGKAVEFTSPFVSLIGKEGDPRLDMFIADASTGQLSSRASIVGRLDQLAGDPVSGNLYEDQATSPCLDIVIALRGENRFRVFDTCENAEVGAINWRDDFSVAEIELDPPAKIDAAPQIVDMNGDGHLDVLLGAGGRAYVAYGDGKVLAPATPYRLTAREPLEVPADIEMPLAVGDFTGDGALDFVFPHYLLYSVSNVDGIPDYYSGIRNHLDQPWTSAIITDFNGNGLLDVVAASDNGLGIEYFNGTGSASFGATTITTSAPVQFLAHADFDGDLTSDLVFVEKELVPNGKSSVKVAFGTPFALPAKPITVSQIFNPKALNPFQERAIGTLAVPSEAVIDGEKVGMLTFLDDGGDRVPFAALALTNFEQTGNVLDSAAIALSAGRFTKKSSAGDLVALALPELFPNAPPPATEAWFLPEIEQPGAFPRRLTEVLDPRLKGAAFADGNRDIFADVASVAVDLDDDDLDEAVFAMPAGAERDQCGLVIFQQISSSGAAEPTLGPREPMFIAEPCADPRLAAVDADNDGKFDLLLLTGSSGGNTRKLLLLWNDGTGGFSADDMQLISGTDSPQAFTVMPRLTPHGATESLLRLAYVTDSEARLLATRFRREFSEPETLLSGLVGASGIAASDVDGDGIADLAVADSGRLRILRSRLWVAP